MEISDYGCERAGEKVKAWRERTECKHTRIVKSISTCETSPACRTVQLGVGQVLGMSGHVSSHSNVNDFGVNNKPEGGRSCFATASVHGATHNCDCGRRWKARRGSVPFLPTVQTIASLIEPGLRANQNCTFKALYFSPRGLSASSFLDIIA